MKINGPIFDYQKFISWIEELVEKGITSGENMPPAYAQFTALNLKRMERINKTTQLNSDLEQAINKNDKKQRWVVISEPWCGDSAQTLPLIAKMAAAKSIPLQIILRTDNPDWIEKYHTNGSISIPKLIAFDENDNELYDITEQIRSFYYHFDDNYYFQECKIKYFIEYIII